MTCDVWSPDFFLFNKSGQAQPKYDSFQVGTASLVCKTPLPLLIPKVPRRSESLMGQALQAPLLAEESAQTAVKSDREPGLGFCAPQAIAVGGFAPLVQDLSRASRTRSNGFFSYRFDWSVLISRNPQSRFRSQGKITVCLLRAMSPVKMVPLESANTAQVFMFPNLGVISVSRKKVKTILDHGKRRKGKHWHHIGDGWIKWVSVVF